MWLWDLRCAIEMGDLFFALSAVNREDHEGQHEEHEGLYTKRANNPLVFKPQRGEVLCLYHG